MNSYVFIIAKVEAEVSSSVGIGKEERCSGWKYDGQYIRYGTIRQSGDPRQASCCEAWDKCKSNQSRNDFILLRRRNDDSDKHSKRATLNALTIRGDMIFPAMTPSIVQKPNPEAELPSRHRYNKGLKYTGSADRNSKKFVCDIITHQQTVS